MKPSNMKSHKFVLSEFGVLYCTEQVISGSAGYKSELKYVIAL